jgi:hypothetical protein
MHINTNILHGKARTLAERRQRLQTQTLEHSEARDSFADSEHSLLRDHRLYRDRESKSYVHSHLLDGF